MRKKSELGDRRPEDRERRDRRERLPAGERVRSLSDREREQQRRRRRASLRSRAQARRCHGHGAARRCRRIRTTATRARSQTSRPRAHHPPDVSRPDSTATPSEPEDDTDPANPCHGLVRKEPDAEDEREQRHGRLRDAGHRRVDVLLPPRDQPERKRRVEDPVDHGLPPVRAQLGPHPRRAPRREDESEQDRSGEQRAARHQHRRCDVVDADLDEEVRRAPQGGEQEQPGEISAHRRLQRASAAEG